MRTVRILGLGADAGGVMNVVAAAVARLWGAVIATDVETVFAGDDKRLASRVMRRWCDIDAVDVVLTIGRGGHAAADFAPDVTVKLLDRVLPGIEERMRIGLSAKPVDILFRGRAGFRRGTLVVNLPDRPARARAILGMIGPVVDHAVGKARGSDQECAAVVAGQRGGAACKPKVAAVRGRSRCLVSTETVAASSSEHHHSGRRLQKN